MHNNSRRIGQLKTYDPRTKLYLLLGYLIITLVSWEIIPLLINVFLAVILIFISRVSFQRIAVGSLSAFAMELVAGLIFIFATSVKTGLYITLKLLLFTLVFNAIINTLDQAGIIDGLSKGFGLGAKASKRVSIALYFFPRIYKERLHGVRAQKARGIRNDGSRLRGGARKEVLLTIPNIKSAVIRSTRQSTAMQSRGYTSVKRRNAINTLAFTWVDDIVLLFMVLLIMVSILLMII